MRSNSITNVQIHLICDEFEVLLLLTFTKTELLDKISIIAINVSNTVINVTLLAKTKRSGDVFKGVI